MKHKQETTGTRASPYSLWHRELGEGCFAVDVDWVEYRRGRGIVALLGTTGRLTDERHIENSKQYILRRSFLERQILATISRALGVPAFFVIHTETLDVFHVHEPNEENSFRRYDHNGYKKFIKSL